MMDFEPFAQGQSMIHRMEPGTKLVAAIPFILILALSRSVQTVTVGLLVMLAVFLLARLPLQAVMRRLAAANGFMAFLWLTLPLTYPGSPRLHVGPLAISGSGLDLALLLTLKTNVLILCFLTLIATSSVAQLGHAMERLHVSPKLCLLFLFSYRYLSVIQKEYQRLHRAARLRCFHPSTTMHTYRTYSYLLAMTLVKSWNRGIRTSQALRLRGFQGRFFLSSEPVITRTDRMFLALFWLITATLLFLELRN